ncbi:hypothetical protein FIV37_15940 [Pseudomonas gessardii]|nr:hypothetical protein [Pseudomonas gessardii]
MWERACLRWGSVSQLFYQLTHRNRGQARSHFGWAVFLTDSPGGRFVQGEWVMSAILSVASAPVSQVSNTT